MSEIRFESTDHTFFCVKHRSHSQLHSICPDCFKALRAEVESLKKIVEGFQPSLYLRENMDYREALEKIAKPALGGKQQQYIAKEVLAKYDGHKAREGKP